MAQDIRPDDLRPGHGVALPAGASVPAQHLCGGCGKKIDPEDPDHHVCVERPGAGGALALVVKTRREAAAEHTEDVRRSRVRPARRTSAPDPPRAGAVALSPVKLEAPKRRPDL